MKKYYDPTVELIEFEVMDVVNSGDGFGDGGDNDIESQPGFWPDIIGW